MRKKLLLATLAVLLFAGTLHAHDLFLKLRDYFLPPDADVTVHLINGTFDTSDNAIARDRMLDVSIVGPEAAVVHPDTSPWRDVDNAALLSFRTGPAGTYVLGVSTAPRVIDLEADAFNDYLEHDGVLDMLSARRANGTLGDDARERYAKHVKAVVQVGDRHTGSFDTVLGYPIEIVPLANPYTLTVGDTLAMRVLEEGTPVADQLVYASFEGYHGHDADGRHREAVETRTDDEGVARIALGHVGIWYVRLIHMVELDEDEVTHESKWATLTFQIR